MTLIDNIKYVLRLRNAGVWRADKLHTRIKRGYVKLKDLEEMAQAARCSLVFLASGGRYDYHGEMTAAEAVETSIRHKGLNIHDVARAMGKRNAYTILRELRENTISVRHLVQLAETAGMPLHEMLCDGEQEPAPPEIPGREASPRVINSNFRRMGWG